MYLAFAAALLVAAPALAQEGEDTGRQAVPRASRPQGDNPRTGTAVPRSAPRRAEPAPERSRTETRSRATARPRTVVVPDRRRTVIVQPRTVYPYYPRRSYPYGYGAFGLGYFYYDPYRWSGAGYPGYYGDYGGYGGGYPRSYSSFDVGELRLDVSPRFAQVYVDGYYAGTVDDFDGAFQALKLESGAYRIEIIAPGHETLTFDVRINPGQKIRYRGDLQRY
jgi:hypothetical protein